MKQTAAIVASLSALLPLVSADFTIWAAEAGGNGIVANTDTGVQVYAPDDDVIGCKVDPHGIWLPQTTTTVDSDVSQRAGVRCEADGDGCSGEEGGDPSTITQLELSANGKWGTLPHFTYYKDRDGGIYDLDGKNIGKCTPSDNARFQCPYGKTAEVIGARLLECQSSLTSDDINGKKGKRSYARMYSA